MTITDKTAAGQTETISFEVELQHAPEKVWRALTTPALLREWLLPVTGLDLTPGAEFMYSTDPYPGWDGTVKCKMLEVEPRRKLSYTWTAPSLDTVVTFELSPTASGTRLSIVQTGFKTDQRRESGGARYGWNMMGQKFIDLLARSA